MNTLNWLLLNGAEVVLSAWHALESAAVWAWSVIDAILNPILSPLLSLLNPLCTRLGDAIYAAIAPLPIWLGLTFLSAIAGVVMLIAFRYTSNQKAIGRAKDDIKANLLALKLYKDDLRVTFTSQGRILWAILRLQRHVLTPVLLMALPMLLALAQMGVRYQWRPLRVGERTLLRLWSASPGEVAATAKIEPNSGLIVEVGPIAGEREVVWRVRGGQPGRHTLRFDLGATTLDKEVVVGDAFQRVSALRPGRRWTEQLFHPAEPLLPASANAQAIELLYPSVDSWIHGADYWVVYFFVVSMAAALIFKPLFKVRF